MKHEIGLTGDIQVNSDIAKVSIVGAGMIDRPGVASTMFETLAQQGINIRMISTSEIKISFLVDKKDAQKAIKALHEVFELASDVVAEVKGDLPNV
jgi:aspartate kinase